MVVIRKTSLKDLNMINSFLKKTNQEMNKDYLKKVLCDDETLSLISEDKEVNGLIICKKIGDLIEIIKWESESDELFNEIITKAAAKGFSKIVTIEKQSEKKRLKKLLNIGFKAVRTNKGIFNEENALMLIKNI